MPFVNVKLIHKLPHCFKCHLWTFYLFSTLSGPICAVIFHYKTICRLSFINNHFRTIPPVSHKLFNQHLPSGGFTNANQLESPVQYFLFIYSLFKTLKVYVIVHITQVTCNIYCIYFNAMCSNLSRHATCNLKLPFVKKVDVLSPASSDLILIPATYS